jgi:hypothetical protein
MSPRAVAYARRASGLLLAVVLVASQASAWFHAVAIAHVACLEHGEAVHRAAVRGGDGRATMPRDTGPAGLRADLAAAGGHDHCANAALLRWRDVTLTAPSTLAPLAVAARSLSFAPARDSGHGAVLYRLAPKTSPPFAVA